VSEAALDFSSLAPGNGLLLLSQFHFSRLGIADGELLRQQEIPGITVGHDFDIAFFAQIRDVFIEYDFH
jgi:hypothetical protein